MSKIKKQALFFLIIGALAVIGTIMDSKRAAADGGPSVTIVSPLPLPVTGTVSASGTVAATQSGTWNVGVAGTVAATQNGTWSVGIAGTPGVNVSNPATAPALFLNVNDPGRIPYASFQTPSCSNPCFAIFPAVPSGRRLVIQHFSTAMLFSGTPNNLVAFLAEGMSNTAASSMVLPPLSGNTAAFDQAVLGYYDQGQNPDVAYLWNGGATASQVFVTLTGYMLDCTIAPCAAIAH